MDINLSADRILSESDCAKIRAIKTKIVSMLKERQALNSSVSSAQPSTFWSNTCACFDYLLDLPERYFVRLRTHTYHITSDNYLLYNGPPAGYRETWDIESHGVPESCKLNEPEGGIGFRYPDGRFISKDILRFQAIVSDLYRQKVLDHLWNKADRAFILEIGAGYGALLHHLSRIHNKTTCVILDLPETLIFSAAYLSLLNPQKKIYIYDKNDFTELIRDNKFASYDFVILPNYVLDALAEIHFDLILNTVSFGEMRLDQVEQYLDFIGKSCRGFFYSYNADRHIHNYEMSNLSELLHSRFDIRELHTPTTVREESAGLGLKRKTRRMLKRMAISIGLIEDQREQAPVRFPYRRYLCTPRPEPIHRGPWEVKSRACTC